MTSSKLPKSTIPLLTSLSGCRGWRRQVRETANWSSSYPPWKPYMRTSQPCPSREANDMTVVLTLANPVQRPLDGGGTRNQTDNINADGVRGLCYNRSLEKKFVSCGKACKGNNKLNRIHAAVLHNVMTVIISLLEEEKISETVSVVIRKSESHLPPRRTWLPFF